MTLVFLVWLSARHAGLSIHGTEPTTGLEPVTSSLPRKCSTTELGGHEEVGRGGAGDRVRTGDVQLGRLTLYQLSYSRGQTFREEGKKGRRVEKKKRRRNGVEGDGF